MHCFTVRAPEGSEVTHQPSLRFDERATWNLNPPEVKNAQLRFAGWGPQDQQLSKLFGGGNELQSVGLQGRRKERPGLTSGGPAGAGGPETEADSEAEAASTQAVGTTGPAHRDPVASHVHHRNTPRGEDMFSEMDLSDGEWRHAYQSVFLDKAEKICNGCMKEKNKLAIDNWKKHVGIRKGSKEAREKRDDDTQRPGVPANKNPGPNQIVPHNPLVHAGWGEEGVDRGR
ncbi:hypothetical protein EYF80_007205 [Liparis tanakae]|uniref:Uncharacterized protein n=1 Tax=Liparis tanakae TaxID=230148 RepID=A0A4Z2IY36_9TELE|nr:hypothetical protein EYF80_007205 [Liparis tanakae]